ncbi:hypothetical protein BDV28DRAFT_149023 [Aspergillus coremiiformis]|uniref:Uncharacterized protein n=1 Tax=Aspergillus coremiiformis TaxID=138285 RepID=A0A5N6Z6A2_9EURO|nr:hypothetical protein BDV28DRAFT_149023 [Aspergillus coremiiformis]
MNDMGQAFLRDHRDPPLQKWYPTHPSHPFLQLEDYCPAETRPRPDFSSKVATADAAKVAEATLITLTIPNAGDRRYIALLDLPQESGRVQPGDRLCVNFSKEDQHTTQDWQAVVVNPAPFAPVSLITAMLIRPWSPDTGQWRHWEDDTMEPHPIKVDTFSSARDAQKAIRQCPGQSVKLKFIPSGKPFSTQMQGLREIQNVAQHMWPSLLANDLRRTAMRPVNIYSTIAQDFQGTFLVSVGFNGKQREAFDGLRSLPGPIGLVYGPPGTGDRSGQVLITASANNVIDDAARLMNALVRDHTNNRSQEAIITQCHAIYTKDIAWKPATWGCPRQGRHDIIRNGAATPRMRKHSGSVSSESARPSTLDNDEGVLDELTFFHMVFQFYQAQTMTATGLAAKRAVHVELSLGHRMLQMTGIIPCLWRDPDSYRAFIEFFHQYRRSESMDPETIVQFRVATKILREAVLKRTDVIVATSSPPDSMSYTLLQEVVGRASRVLPHLLVLF